MEHHPRAFIVSDSSSNGDLITQTARGLGYRSIRTHHGLQLLKHLQQEQAGTHSDDIIIVDLSFDAWIGINLLEILVRELYAIRVLVITDAAARMQSQLYELGARILRGDPLESAALKSALLQGHHAWRLRRPMASMPARVHPVIEAEHPLWAVSEAG